MWVRHADFGCLLSEDVQNGVSMATCILVLLWHSLKMTGSYMECSWDGWWELAGICGSASVASAAGAGACLLASLPVPRWFFFLRKTACVLCIEIDKGQ